MQKRRTKPVFADTRQDLGFGEGFGEMFKNVVYVNQSKVLGGVVCSAADLEEYFIQALIEKGVPDDGEDSTPPPPPPRRRRGI